MSTKIRLYFSYKIQSDLIAHLTKDQTHYIKDVMRLKIGENLSVFNNSGEWNATIQDHEKKGTRIKILQKVREKDYEKNIWLAFSPIKQNPLNFLILSILISLTIVLSDKIGINLCTPNSVPF